MKKFANYAHRSQLDHQIMNQLRKQIPHFEFEHRLRRSVYHPKIILYSSLASTDKFIQQYSWPYLGSSPPST